MIIKFITGNIYYLLQQSPPLIMAMLIAFPWFKTHYGLWFFSGSLSHSELARVCVLGAPFGNLISLILYA